MRKTTWALFILSAALFSMPESALGRTGGTTVRGMFGDRELGRPLKPAARTLLGPGMTDSYGGFRGRGRDQSLQFPSMPWQRAATAPAWPSPGHQPAEPIPAKISPRRPPAVSPPPLRPPPREPEPSTAPPADQWLRVPTRTPRTR
ncbi:MAG TPA: hypothetical protein PLF81_10865 [Candidatus Anammoximicrobium sp.]|nr:hypothetical protein [Candidatus Anammoximicrobium sp.]